MAQFGISFALNKNLVALCLTGCCVTGTAAAQPPTATYMQLYEFAGGSDGANPSTPVIADDFGNLYGMASYSGVACPDAPYTGCGTIYKLDSTGHLTTLYAFPGGASGLLPMTGLTLLRGTLFGTAQIGGNSDGVVFSIGTDGSHYTVLHQFAGPDGQQPAGLLQRAPYGGVYGVTGGGGSTFAADGGRGVLFYLQSGGAYKVLHDFLGSDGLFPSSLEEDASGNLFGSTQNGGDACTTVKYGCGVVFEYQPQTKIFTVLHAFQGGADGQGPLLGSVGPDGTVYGVTQSRGGAFGHGTLFSLAPADRGYTYTNLISFPPAYSGEGPLAGPALARNGALFVPTRGYLYGYQNGKLRTLYAVLPGTTAGYATSELFIPPHGTTAYDVTNGGGLSSCTYVSGLPDVGGCGTIVSFALPSPTAK